MEFNKPLFEAAQNGLLDQCEALIFKNADVNWKNPEWVVTAILWQI